MPLERARNRAAIAVAILAAFASCVDPFAPKATAYETVSVFHAWTPAEDVEADELILARYDLAFGSPYQLLRTYFEPRAEEPYVGLATALSEEAHAEAAKRREDLLDRNPGLKLLVEIRYKDAWFVAEADEGEGWWEKGYFPPDSDYWLRDENGNRVVGWGEDTNLDGTIGPGDDVLYYLIDFTNPAVQDLIAEQAAAVEDSGLFDGIMLDWMSEWATTDDATIAGWDPVLSDAVERQARLELISKIRARTSDDFIIIGNSNYSRNPTLTPLLNGVFMECYKDRFDRGYTDDELAEIEAAVIFNQENCAEPVHVCLEGWRVCEAYDADRETRIQERDSPENRQWMRFFTTMMLTLSDGHVLFSDDNALPVSDHRHNWYDFWDAPIGEPIGDRGRRYQDVAGLFIREYENAWVVYNRSGSERRVEFDVAVEKASTGGSGKSFTLSNKDGEIYLKT